MLEPVHLICGGFPCQDISNAGKRAGISGKRSGLWKELLRTICMVRPKYALVENVAALLRLGMGTVLGDLAESGYDSEWDCIPAASVGAPHLRDRVFIMAYTMRGSGCAEFGKQQSEWTTIINPSGAGDVADTQGSVSKWDGAKQGGEQDGSADESWWAVEPNVGRVAHGVPSRVDRLKCLGNAVVPQVAQKIGEMILSAEK